MSAVAGEAKLIKVSACSKEVVVVFNSIIPLKSLDKWHSKIFYTKLMELETNISIVGSFL
jgi:hypothetical protein